MFAITQTLLSAWQQRHNLHSCNINNKYPWLYHCYIQPKVLFFKQCKLNWRNAPHLNRGMGLACASQGRTTGWSQIPITASSFDFGGRRGGVLPIGSKTHKFIVIIVTNQLFQYQNIQNYVHNISKSKLTLILNRKLKVIWDADTSCVPFTLQCCMNIALWTDSTH
jgi:hypothetical protein